MDYSGHHPLRPLCDAWCKKIQLGLDYKKEHFQDDADEAMAFFNGPYDWIYRGKDGMMKSFLAASEDGDRPRVTFGMTVNKTAELVQIFGPALYHRNPFRQANPRKPPIIDFASLSMDPSFQMMAEQQMMEQAMAKAVDAARATLIQHYLNYTPNALDLKTESRWSIDECLIKGMGLLNTEVYTPSGATNKMVGSFHISVDDLVIDPDVERFRDAKWIAVRCRHPHWEVEEEYGWPLDSLKRGATSESYSQTAETNTSENGDYDRKQGTSNDLVTYWKVYSKMGLGGRMRGVDNKFREWDNVFGYYVYLVVAEGVPCPLNLPPETIAQANNEEIKRRLQWPTPFWADDVWPVSPLIFHDVPRKVWPMSHLKPAMGELYFLNWAYSFLANKVRVSCRDFIVIAKSAAEEVKNKILNAPDYTMIEIEALMGDIDKMVKFLQHPEFNPEIYKVIEGVTQNFEKRTGLTELVYGMTASQMRSAEEANVKSDQISVRPDDMANKVEDWMSDTSRHEALAARWHLTGEDVAPMLGKVGGQWWQQLVVPSDVSQILHQIEFRIEAGSVRKPNKSKQIADMATVMQTLFQPFMQYYQATGDPMQLNGMLTDWAKANDFEVEKYLFPPLNMQAPPAGEPPPEA